MARVNCGATFDICILFHRLRVNIKHVDQLDEYDETVYLCMLQ